ncbi:hypothetical protein HAZT_HAZT011741 [Hyalella azteca]|uniref:Uncharacterized protein n=1 Tax=Hyalella azteca TaxID=294128 RepID=A0A6A0H6K9_HYAAZ|nr:hypothetical protein HAZT_HAZT011741 [Hyalella azteca]
MAPILHKDPPLVIKQIPAEKTNKNKKEKGPTREEYMRRVRSLVDKLTSGGSPKIVPSSVPTEATPGSAGVTNGTSPDEAAQSTKVSEACQAYKDIKLPDRLAADAAHALFSSILKLDEGGREIGSQLLVQLRTENLISQDKLWDGLKQVLSEVEAGLSDCPRGKGQLAEVLAQLVLLNTFTLAELADPMQAGEHFPLYLLVLQHLHKLAGKPKLTQLFNDSKVNLLNLVPESERTKEQLSDLLEDRQLSFLFPLLRIQSQLSSALANEPSPHAFFKYIKDTLDVKHHTAPEFVNALVTVLLKHITHETTMAPGTDLSLIPEKGVTEKEKELLARFKPVLQAFLHSHNDLQVYAIYALQVFTYTNNFPKGMLLHHRGRSLPHLEGGRQ